MTRTLFACAAIATLLGCPGPENKPMLSEAQWRMSVEYYSGGAYEVYLEAVLSDGKECVAPQDVVSVNVNGFEIPLADSGGWRWSFPLATAFYCVGSYYRLYTDSDPAQFTELGSATGHRWEAKDSTKTLVVGTENIVSGTDAKITSCSGLEQVRMIDASAVGYVEWQACGS